MATSTKAPNLNALSQTISELCFERYKSVTHTSGAHTDVHTRQQIAFFDFYIIFTDSITKISSRFFN